jgi:predicted flap endonuclease-1-like 5' DNA nuclease
MSAWAAFFLGLLLGWLIEWLIDWWYWRRRYNNLLEENKKQAELLTGSKSDSAQLTRLAEENNKLAIQAERCNSDLKAKQEEIGRLTQEISELNTMLAKAEFNTESVMVAPVSFSGIESKTAEAVLPQAENPIIAVMPPEPVEVIPDDLIIINGIGPKIAQLLNNAGIFTFEQLAAQTPQSLESLLGDVIRRLADEDSLISQARELADKKKQK